jgi:glycogen(starch) synthase
VRVLAVGNRCLPWSIGGYEVMWRDSVEFLRSAGHEVRMLTTLPDPTDLAGDPPPDTDRELRWYWRAHAFPPTGLRQSVALERANAAVFDRHVLEFAPDAVVWWAMGGMSLSLLARPAKAGLPALGIVADDWMSYGPRVDGWLKRWRRPSLAPFGALADALTGLPARVDIGAAARWLFISRHTLETARDAGVDVAGAAVAPAGVDGSLFTRSEPGPWRWRLLYCGRIEERKGVDTAVRALASLPAESTLVLQGPVDPGYREQLTRIAAAAGGGAEGRIEFAHGPHDRLPAVYAAADALVFPVRWREPWGLVPLEAMATGRPVIASRAGGGASEYLVDGGNCLQFTPGDPVGLADAVSRLAGDSALRERLVDAGRETAGRFTQQAFVERIERELVALNGR